MPLSEDPRIPPPFAAPTLTLVMLLLCVGSLTSDRNFPDEFGYALHFCLCSLTFLKLSNFGRMIRVKLFYPDRRVMADMAGGKCESCATEAARPEV